MAYMRGEFYIWSDGEQMHFNDFAMPMEVVDQFVAMRWARMSGKERERSIIQAIDNHQGNFGCDALCEQFSVDTAAAQVAREVKRLTE